ncbi:MULTISPECIES: 50S ribosomal protein L13 [Anaerofustis]|uniref:50S ribosomal protein L13 n=1 Tax=Anaerofustis TaxID=264995 RepID=UPI0011073388|nr:MULTISPECIES: 50S ribosomal protein L13 [Anaerofustis]MCO8194570.1 50S ribosomal protein L13 [Anaerofustis sp. NSJ-163]
MLTKSTSIAKPQQIDKKWYVVDAEGKTLGRLCSEVAKVLTGKNKPCYTPNIDTGDYVIVINAEKIHLTGNKLLDKKYYRHTGYPGGRKEVMYKDLIANKPEFVIEKAVKGMLPKNKLGRAQFKKLKVYAGSEHEHAAQKPEVLDIK